MSFKKLDNDESVGKVDKLRLSEQEAIAQREQEFRSLAESSPDSIIRYDLEGRIIYLNSKLEGDLGYTTAELKGKLTREVWPDGRFAEIEQAVLQAIADGEKKTVVMHAAIQTSNPHYHQIRIVPERDAEGEIIGALAFGSDVTEIYRLQEAVAAREQEFRTLVEHSPDVIVRFDRECRRTYINPTMIAWAGPYADKLLGTTPSQFPGREGLPGCEQWLQLEEKLREVMDGQEQGDFELTWPDADGNVRHVLLRLVPEFDYEGKVIGALSLGRDITELNEYREKLHGLAFYDSVTGLANRALFGDRLNQAIAEARRHGTQLGVMLLDLDRFKVVNDTMGHYVGDKLLREAGERLSKCVRDYDTVARLGGDEFIVLLPYIRDAKNLSAIAEKIILVLAEPFVLDKREVFIGSSIGIALYPHDSDDVEGLIKSADLAMYSAKRAGGNCPRYYSAELTLQTQEWMRLETELRRALERDELELHFQPKVSLADKRILGTEALLRWSSSEFGMVMPERFIGIAEDTGLIITIGAWVLYEACRTACVWNAEDKPFLRIAVNLSPRQFADGGLVQTIEEALHDTGCHPEWIELEITERLLLGNSDQVRRELEELRAMGLTIAMDDFGTGYSALSYLTNFPIDVLKIDRSFVKDLMSDPKKAELVKAIIAMADGLKMGLVAEGVETEEQAQFLREIGCATAQGFLFGKPMRRDELEDGTYYAE